MSTMKNSRYSRLSVPRVYDTLLAPDGLVHSRFTGAASYPGDPAVLSREDAFVLSSGVRHVDEMGADGEWCHGAVRL